MSNCKQRRPVYANKAWEHCKDLIRVVSNASQTELISIGLHSYVFLNRIEAGHPIDN